MAQGAAAARRPTVIRQATIAAALLALGTVTGALAGCGKPAPDPTPTSSSTTPSPTATETAPTPTASPSPTPPAKPAAWTTNDDTGALAAAQYFMDLYNYVIATGDLTEWKALAGPECEFCMNVADSIDRLYASGGHYDGGVLTTSDASYARFDEGTGLHVVSLKYSTEPMRRIDSDGTVTNTTEAESGLATFDLRPVSGGWALSVVTSQPDAP